MTQLQHPVISVIIPTHNRREMLGAAITSALAQDLENIEVIVVNDGSTDGTDEYLKSIADPRLRVIQNIRKKGPAGARNSAMLMASGEYLAFLDDDDLYLPGHLSAAARVFASEAKAGLVFGWAEYRRDGLPVTYMGPKFTEKVAKIEPRRDVGEYVVFDGDCFDVMLDQGSFFNLSTVVIRRSLVEQGLIYDEDLWGAEDYEYWLRIARQSQLAYLKAAQITYTIHTGNISVSDSPAVIGRNLSDGVTLCQHMTGYSNLSRESRHKINRNLARALFDLGHFLRRQGDIAGARARYTESLKIQFNWLSFKAYLKSLLLSPRRTEYVA